jgi:DNA-binding protein YbaB
MKKKIIKPIFDWTKPKLSLVDIKRYIIETAESELSWYSCARWKNAIFTRTFRFIALILFAFGLIYPLIGIETVHLFGIDINNLGYLCLSAGGLILLFDKYFGLSSGFVRFYLAEEEIKKEINDFEIAWEIEIAKAESSNYTIESVVNTLSLAKVLRQDISKTIQFETSAWASEFQTQIGELQELLKQKTEEYKKKSGTISVKVENSIEYSEIELILDDTIIKKLLGTTSAIFKDAPLGIHIIQIRAKKKDKLESFSQNFEVTIDKTTEVILKLP